MQSMTRVSSVKLIRPTDHIPSQFTLSNYLKSSIMILGSSHAPNRTMGCRLSKLSCIKSVKGSRSARASESEDIDLEASDIMESEVWKNLPEDILLKHIVCKLPFNSLLEFCSVSWEWNRFIRSMNNRPNCRSSKSILIHSFAPLRILNTRSGCGRWVCPPPFLSNLRVLASAGGLLCMSTHHFGELLIWNPITKSQRSLQLPLDTQRGYSSSNCLHEVLQSHSEVSNPDLDRRLTKLINSGSLRVGMSYRPRTNSYQIIVAAVSLITHGETVIYDSLTRQWKPGPGIPRGVRFELNSVSSQCGRYFYCAITSGAHNYLLEFDVDHSKWTCFRVYVGMGNPEGLIEHRGMVLLVTRTHPGREVFSVYELHVRMHAVEEYKWELRTPEHVPEMLSKNVYGAMRTRAENMLMRLGDRYVQCYGRGDLLFFVGMSVEKCNTPQSCRMDSRTVTSEAENYYRVESIRRIFFLKSYLRVWIHDTSTDRVLHLTEWEFEGYDDANLLSFQLLNPSLCSQA